MQPPIRPVHEASQMDLAYLAGLIDGEGTVGLEKRHSADAFRAPLLSIATTDRELLALPLAVLGGDVIPKRRKIKSTHKDAYEWRLRYNAARDALTVLLPHLRCPEKARRARGIVHIYPTVTPRNGKYDAAMLAAKQRFEVDFYNTDCHFS